MADETIVTPDQTQVATPDATPAAEDVSLLGKSADEIAKLAGEKSETQKTEEKPKDDAKSTVPETYSLKAPEGMTVDQGMLDKLTPTFKELGLSQDAVQKLADAYAPVVKAQVEAQAKKSIDVYKEVVDGWKAESTKELGSEPAKSLALAAKAINKFGTDGGAKLREVLNETGLGNHIEVVRFFMNVGKSISEDSFVEPHKQSTGTVSFYDHPTSKATLK